MILLAADLEKFLISVDELEQKEKGLHVPVIAIPTECAICLGSLDEPETLVCGHSFCVGCVEELQSTTIGASPLCPLCRKPVITKAQEASVSAAGGAAAGPVTRSSKTREFCSSSSSCSYSAVM